MELLWAAAGALFSLVFYIMYEFAGSLRTPTGLFQVWHSMWQHTSTSSWDWVTEKIEVRRSLLGGIRLISLGSPSEKWTGKARMVSNTYLIGEWKSKVPGSHSEGVFALTFATSGRYLMGYFLSRDLDRGKIASGFVVGRTEQDAQEARQRLESMRIKFPKSP